MSKKKKKSEKNQSVDDQECVRLNQLVDIAYHLSQWIFSPKERREKEEEEEKDYDEKTLTDTLQSMHTQSFFYPNCNQNPNEHLLNTIEFCTVW